MPTRRFPLAIRAKLKAELDRIQKMGVITPVSEPTSWVSQIVTTIKRNGELRICINPKDLNKVLKREHYILPTLDDTLHELGQSRYFTKADLRAGFWHIQLDEESSKLLAFQTFFGRYRWRRLPFGTAVSSEIFAKKLAEAIDGLPGVICIAEDVVIHGKSEEEHDRHLELFMNRCRERGIALNRYKFAMKLKEVIFTFHVIGERGLQPYPAKVKAISGMASPTNIEELRRFLGIVNFFGKFLPHLATINEPLRNLTKNDVPWNWSIPQETAFNSLKDMITTQGVRLGLYDPTKELTLENDASESDASLWSCMMQVERPISFASRTLSDAERRYAQIEKEMLAVVYGLEKTISSHIWQTCTNHY